MYQCKVCLIEFATLMLFGKHRCLPLDAETPAAAPGPKKPWKLSENDRKFLKGLRIASEDE